ncbi:hypothetical protein GF420_08710 [candidate division GN15 bacterium]|nr:hypothetical protein [candidate division GN15 bacterium]
MITPNYVWLNTHSPIKVDQLPNLKAPEELKIICGFVPAFKSEPHTVPDKALKSKLYTYYGSRVPPATYWGQKATDLIEFLDDFSDDNKRLRKVVERFADLPTDEAKIAAAYNWLRDSILNLNYFDLVEWDDGRRKSKEPDDIETADDLFKHRYGWRTDIDKAFADMLREMNIDARYCYAKDRFDDLLVTDAKYWQLDRSLVAVPTAEPGKYTFYTVGRACTPIEKAPWFLEGVQALIGGGRDLMVPIPFSPPDYSITQTMYNVEITEDLEAFGTMSSRLTGHDAYGVRITLVDEDTADFAGLLKEETEASYPDAKVDSITVDQLDDLTEPVLVACQLTYPELTTAGSRILLKPFDYCSSVENPFYAPERKNAILFNWAYELKESAHLVLPEGYVIEALPADTTFENVTGRCMIGFQQMGNTVVAQRFFRLKHPFWNVADYPALQELFQARQDLSGQVVVLKEGEFIDESDSELEAPIEPKVTEPAEKTTGL